MSGTDARSAIRDARWRGFRSHLLSRLAYLASRIGPHSPLTTRTGRRACKPGSVSWHAARKMVIYLASTSPPRSSGQTRRTGGRPAQRPSRSPDRHPPYSALLPVGFAWLRRLPGRPVRSYRTVSPSPIRRTKIEGGRKEPNHRFVLSVFGFRPSDRQSAFCCTCRSRLAPGPRCYLAPRPLEPGLSYRLRRSTIRPAFRTHSTPPLVAGQGSDSSGEDAAPLTGVVHAGGPGTELEQAPDGYRR